MQDRNFNSKQTDYELIDKALAGDQSAFEKLMKKYYNMIKNLINRMIQKSDDSEDLAQEAFIKAFNSLDKFDRQFAFSTWLFKIATNNCIDYLRKKKLNTFSIDKDFSSEDEDLRFEIADTESLPDRNLIEEQKKKIINEAIDKLPAKYKEVIILRHKTGMEYEEIAEKLDIPLGTVKAHIFRGRELLHKCLKDKLVNF